MKRLELKQDGKILGFGEIMLRLTPENSQMIIQTSKFDATYAGGEANVVCSLSMFGHETKMLTKLPDNPLGEKVVRDLSTFGVDTKDIIKGDGRLGIYFLEQGAGLRNSEVVYDRKYSSISLANKNEFNIENILKDVKVLHVSGITPALSSELFEFTLELVKSAKDKGIVVSYDSNYRAKLWSLEDAGRFMGQVLPYVDIAFLGILDFKNILKYPLEKEEEFEKNLVALYSKLFENYPNLKFAASTKRWVNSVSNNSLQGFLFNGNTLEKSKKYTFDIIDRVGGGDSFTAGVLHGLLSEDMKEEEIINFATCASVLKHSIKGDINMVGLNHVMTLMNSGIENIKR
ncbi:sugar kinase [Clostridium sp. SHJSY1]|uniref:sugar kinase n=1 Tax=Clostridium sp. SHJSY1 TaxID=2942483 RepID=UPI0028751740|nr:sugar kinase [Clostridium sp. SHJSY1]MDS0526441.1 sugar kinase [Clostridium sp. SHJSY1]